MDKKISNGNKYYKNIEKFSNQQRCIDDYYCSWIENTDLPDGGICMCADTGSNLQSKLNDKQLIDKDVNYKTEFDSEIIDEEIYDEGLDNDEKNFYDKVKEYLVNLKEKSSIEFEKFKEKSSTEFEKFKEKHGELWPVITYLGIVIFIFSIKILTILLSRDTDYIEEVKETIVIETKEGI